MSNTGSVQKFRTNLIKIISKKKPPDLLSLIDPPSVQPRVKM